MSYFTRLLPSNYCNGSIPDLDRIGLYSFAINPFDIQPSGTLNFSILDDAEMLVTLNSSSLNLENKQIRIFASSYNILRIMSGHSGIAFIE